MRHYWRAAAVIITVLCSVAWGAIPATAGYWNLHRGSKGAQVRTLEVRLHQLNLLPRRQVDRRYRVPTVRAVKKFQRQMRMRATGRVNVRTWNLIAREVQRRTAPKPRPAPPPAPFILGHRGARVANIPENTMASMRYGAITADILEFDLRLTADGEFVLMHDDTLDRTTNCTGPVRAQTLEYLQTACLVDLNAASAPSERIPTFRSVVEYAASTGKPIAPELKASATSNGGLTQEHLAEFVSTIQENGMVRSTYVQSFSSALFPRLRALDNTLTFVFLVASSTPPATVKASGAVVAGPSISGLTADRVAAFRAAGLHVWPWPASTSAQLQSLWAMRVSGVFTDIPATAREMYH